MALNVAKNLIETGGVPRGMLGLMPGNLSKDLAEAFGLESTKGALVNQVQEGSPADQAGIQHGDVITFIDDMKIDSAPQLRLAVSQIPPGTQVAVTLLRGGETLELEVTLGSLNGVPVGSSGANGNIVLGAQMEAVDDDLRESLDIPEGISGVVVLDVESDSPLADSLRPSMVILEVNDKKVRSAQEVGASLKERARNKLYIWIDGRLGFVVLKL